MAVNYISDVSGGCRALVDDMNGSPMAFGNCVLEGFDKIRCVGGRAALIIAGPDPFIIRRRGHDDFYEFLAWRNVEGEQPPRPDNQEFGNEGLHDQFRHVLGLGVNALRFRGRGFVEGFTERAVEYCAGGDQEDRDVQFPSRLGDVVGAFDVYPKGGGGVRLGGRGPGGNALQILLTGA